MAQRVRVDTSTLRGLKPRERVTAKPVDTYSSVGNMVQTNSKTRQIANALAQLSPAVDNYINQERTRKNEAQEEEGYQTYLESTQKERKAFAQAIRKGEIDEVQSPWFVEGLSRGVLRDKSREFGQQLILGWNKNKDNKGFNITDFAAQERSRFISENGLDSFDASLFNEEFGARSERFVEIVNQRQYEHKLQQAKQAQLDLLEKDLFAAREDATVITEDENGAVIGRTFDTDKYVGDVNEVIQRYIDQGLDPKTAIDQAVAQLQALADANLEDREAYIGAIGGIKVRNGLYGETGTGSLFIEKLRDQLDSEFETQQDQEDKDNHEATMEEGEAIFTEVAELINIDNRSPEQEQELKDHLKYLSTEAEWSAMHNQAQSLLDHNRDVTTDPKVKADYLKQILAGNVNDELRDQIINDTELSFPDKIDLWNKTGSGLVLSNIQNNLIGTNVVEEFVQANLAEWKNPLGISSENVQYDALLTQTRLATMDIVLEAAQDHNLQTTEGRNNAIAQIQERFEDFKKNILEPQKEALRKELGVQVDDPSIPTDENHQEAIRQLQGMSPVSKKIYGYLPSTVINTPAKRQAELMRPPSELAKPIYKDTRGDDMVALLPDTKKELLQLVDEYQSILGDPEKAWSGSKLVVLSQQLQMPLADLLEVLDAKIVTAEDPSISELAVEAATSGEESGEIADAFMESQRTAIENTLGGRLGTWVGNWIKETVVGDAAPMTLGGDDFVDALMQSNPNITMEQARKAAETLGKELSPIANENNEKNKQEEPSSESTEDPEVSLESGPEQEAEISTQAEAPQEVSLLDQLGTVERNQINNQLYKFNNAFKRVNRLIKDEDAKVFPKPNEDVMDFLRRSAELWLPFTKYKSVDELPPAFIAEVAKTIPKE